MARRDSVPRIPFSYMFLVWMGHRDLIGIHGGWKWNNLHLAASTRCGFSGGSPPCQDSSQICTCSTVPYTLSASPLGLTCVLVLPSARHCTIEVRDTKDCHRFQSIFPDSNLFFNLHPSSLPNCVFCRLQALAPDLIHFSLGIAKW